MFMTCHLVAYQEGALCKDVWYHDTIQLQKSPRYWSFHVRRHFGRVSYCTNAFTMTFQPSGYKCHSLGCHEESLDIVVALHYCLGLTQGYSHTSTDHRWLQWHRQNSLGSAGRSWRSWETRGSFWFIYIYIFFFRSACRQPGKWICIEHAISGSIESWLKPELGRYDYDIFLFTL